MFYPDLNSKFLCTYVYLVNQMKTLAVRIINTFKSLSKIKIHISVNF